MADVGNLRFYQRCEFRGVDVIRDAFTEAEGYPPDLVADGIPVRDAIRLEYELGRTPVVSAERDHRVPRN